MSMQWGGDAVSIAKPWPCKKCGHENKGTVTECVKCGHEPVLGRRDIEQRRWSESHKQEEDA